MIAAAHQVQGATQAKQDYDRCLRLGNLNFEAGASLYVRELHQGQRLTPEWIAIRLRKAAYESPQHRHLSRGSWADDIVRAALGSGSAAVPITSTSETASPASEPPRFQLRLVRNSAAVAPAAPPLDRDENLEGGNLSRETPQASIGVGAGPTAAHAQAAGTNTEAVSTKAEPPATRNVTVAQNPELAAAREPTAQEPPQATPPSRHEETPEPEAHGMTSGAAKLRDDGLDAKLAAQLGADFTTLRAAVLHEREQPYLPGCPPNPMDTLRSGATQTARAFLPSSLTIACRPDEVEINREAVWAIVTTRLNAALCALHADGDLSVPDEEEERHALTSGALADLRAQIAAEQHTLRVQVDTEEVAEALEEQDAARPPLTELLYRAGFDSLPMSPTAEQASEALRRLHALVEGAGGAERKAAELDAARVLTDMRLKGAGQLVKACLPAAPRAARDDVQGRALTFEELDPWPEPVEGVELVSELVALHQRYVVTSEHAALAAALFDIHTYALDATGVTPYLLYTSPREGCGKSTALEVHRAVVWRPLKGSSFTGPFLFRMIEETHPTLVFDELDNSPLDRSDLLAILNDGYRRGGQTGRLVGDNNSPRVFSTFCPKVLAAIGNLQRTLQSRAITISLQRARRADRVNILDDEDELTNQLRPLRQRIRRWVDDHLADLRANRRPSMPRELVNRAAQLWRPLLAIADVAGAAYPALARRAAVALETVARRIAADDISATLLRDVRAVFDQHGDDRLPSTKLVAALTALSERPWRSWGRHRQPINAAQLATLLRPFRIHSKDLRTEGKGGQKGYERSAFADAWSRYLDEDELNAGDDGERPFFDDAREDVPANGVPSRDAATTQQSPALRADFDPRQTNPRRGSESDLSPCSTSIVAASRLELPPDTIRTSTEDEEETI